MIIMMMILFIIIIMLLWLRMQKVTNYNKTSNGPGQFCVHIDQPFLPQEILWEMMGNSFDLFITISQVT